MLTRIKNKFFKTETNINIHSIQEKLSAIRLKHSEVVLYGSTTGADWVGIKNATIGLFPENSIVIPQWYSNSLFNKKQESKICKTIIDLNFKKVVISGFSPFFFNWINLLYEKLLIEIIFHGTISEFHDENKKEFISNLIQFGKQNKIHRFGFVKDKLSDIFNSLYDFNCYHQPLNQPQIPDNIKKINLDNSKIHIGVFGNDTFNKNLHNQVINSLMIKNSLIHVLDKSIFNYLNMNDRIIEHGRNLPRNQFLAILGSMDLNLYMSYNESWGLIAYESEKMGVPCISHFEIDYNKEILKKLKNDNN